jgi:hypothetical protein
MGLLDESPPNPTQTRGALRDGLEILSQGPPRDVVFQAYTRTVLPLDGFVFWVPTVKETIRGSLHYGQEIVQVEDETQGLATVTFTSEEQVTLFTDQPINTLYVATVDGFRYAFSQQQGLYAQSGPLFHYFGHSIQPAMSTQLLDRPQSIDINQAVTSNSLALWLGLNGYASQFYDGFSNKGVPFKVKPPILFPSFMVAPNETPPYGSVHIGDDDTRALQATPYLDVNRNHYQLVSDRVRITLYGLQNDTCLDFIDTVNQYSLNTNNFGIMNMPVIRDAIRTQAELQTRAMKKLVDFEISYQQTRVAQVARQLILSCVPTLYIK